MMKSVQVGKGESPFLRRCFRLVAFAWMPDMSCQRSVKARRRSQSEQARSQREQPPISSWPRVVPMKELPEAEIKVKTGYIHLSVLTLSSPASST